MYCKVPWGTLRSDRSKQNYTSSTQTACTITTANGVILSQIMTSARFHLVCSKSNGLAIHCLNHSTNLSVILGRSLTFVYLVNNFHCNDVTHPESLWVCMNAFESVLNTPWTLVSACKHLWVSTEHALNAYECMWMPMSEWEHPLNTHWVCMNAFE